jgi:hypothetical protein
VFWKLEHIMIDEKPYTPFARPRNGIEARAQEQVLYGFRTQGGHRSRVHELLGDAYKACPTCAGTGFYGTYGGMGWRYCPACRGLGSVLAISLEELDRRRKQIIDRYPGSAIANWRPYRPIRLPVVDLYTGIVLEADYPEPNIRQLELAL